MVTTCCKSFLSVMKRQNGRMGGIDPGSTEQQTKDGKRIPFVISGVRRAIRKKKRFSVCRDIAASPRLSRIKERWFGTTQAKTDEVESLLVPSTTNSFIHRL